MNILNLRNLALLLLTLGMSSSAHAGRGKTMAKPDFTEGDSIPEGATQNWTLGATGARGWIYSKKMETSEARQIYIVEVDKGSPADGVLKAGDVILGVSGKSFSYDPRTELGKALTTAESEAGKGKLSLIRWRAGKQIKVTVKLPIIWV